MFDLFVIPLQLPPQFIYKDAITAVQKLVYCPRDRGVSFPPDTRCSSNFPSRKLPRFPPESGGGFDAQSTRNAWNETRLKKQDVSTSVFQCFFFSSLQCLNPECQGFLSACHSHCAAQNTETWQKLDSYSLIT